MMAAMKMRIVVVIAAVALLMSPSSIWLRAQGRGRGPAQGVQPIQQVKPGLYMVAGAGANSLVRVTTAGVILMDTKLPGDQNYNDLIAQIKTVTEQPVKFVIVTHHHADHTGNTGKFIEAGAQVLGHENLKRNLETYQNNPLPAQPNLTYTGNEYVVKLGGVEVQVHHFGRSHTSGDSIVYYPDLKVVALSDALTTGTTGPLIDYAGVAGGGSALEWKQVLNRVMALDFDAAIPGNGPVLTKADVQAFKTKFDTVIDRATALVRSGVPKDQLLMQLKTDDIGWAPRIPNVDAFYNELSGITAGKAYKFEKVGDGVFYATATGSMVTGSNNVAIIGDRDVLVVDTGTSPAAARAFVEDLKLITPKPVRYVVNTHFHYDHTDGNQVYAGKADIIAHEYVKYAIEKLDVLHREPYQTSQLTNVPARIENLKKRIADETNAQQKTALERQLTVAQQGWEELKEIKPTAPNVTYSKKKVLNLGSREVQLLFLGRGHTNGDTVVYLPKEKIVCTGDLMESQVAYMGDAQFDEWVATLDALKKLDWETDLPGHGSPFRDRGLITAFQGYLTDLMKQGAELRGQGRTAEQTAQQVDLTKYKPAFPQIQGAGADIRGVKRLYQWMDEKVRK
jgi:cyclase